ncbi:pyrroloquinoline quinone biosynthesis peptide chaperone PqqD [Acidomonas methanolica]|nr:pyrroloquinoline quinone biosynthesis peptide chaperone PqqD [Acidomonas methanolica]
MRRALVPARRASARLCRRASPAGRLPRGRHGGGVCVNNLAPDCVPSFARGHRLREDVVRGVWVIQAPEKALIADPTAAAVLQLVDGQVSVHEIIDRLAAAYDAPREVIAGDVDALLTDLVERKVLAI